jgi:hypothetical protein
MLAHLKLPFAFAALIAASAAFLAWPSASQNRAPGAGIASAGVPFADAAATGAPMHGPTAFGFLEFDWNGALPGFSPWRGDAATADIFPHQTGATE